MELVSLRAAREKGSLRYFTGKPCSHGHVAERFTSSRNCVECAEARALLWKRANPSKVADQRRSWAAANPERNKAIKAAWNKANPESQKVRSRNWYLNNKAKADAATAAWARANPQVGAAATARRRARQLQRTPVWANHEKIESFYEKARALSAETGQEHHVDHIIPLVGKCVSGLHVETNLQILSAHANRSKSNRFQPISLVN